MLDEIDDRSLLLSLAERGARGELIAVAQREEFLASAGASLAGLEQKEILGRAINYLNGASREALEISFISIYAALESVLTFFRHQDEYEILPPQDFTRLERELKRWLKQHPVLEQDAARRGLIYEKVRELNRFPFSHVFKKFRRRYEVDLEDLWPVLGRPAEWPLSEIRHRLVHGDPFASRPAEALACAEEHLRWTVERMLLSVLGWPIAQSNAGRERLTANSESYRNWQQERGRFAEESRPVID